MNLKNNRKESFLNSIPTASVDNINDTISQKCKFNFAYFINDNAGQDFREWEHKQLYELFDKLKEYSKFSLSHWKSEKTFIEYGKFPFNTDFLKPRSIPHQASWSRFRIEGDSRLIGFILPDEYKDEEQHKSGFRFDTNTFYVVFLDEKHRFYITSK